MSLTKAEIIRLVNNYIEVSGGYLGDFSYQSHAEFYPTYCGIDNIDPFDYEGTTRERFIKILETASPNVQAKIIRGIFLKMPPKSFELTKWEQKEQFYQEYLKIINRLELAPSKGISGNVQNLIFAANGPKPEIVLNNATTNEIRIVKNQEYCLIYNRDISSEDGLLWKHLLDWWCDINNSSKATRQEQAIGLYNRLLSSLGSDAEIEFFQSYYRCFGKPLGIELPALVPQVYLHYDPYTAKHLNGEKRLPRQRMDFLLLLPNKIHVVIEIDGKQHYSENGEASPRLYAEMVKEDRRLRLDGYEVFRFGGYEFFGMNQKQIDLLVSEFFTSLFNRYLHANL